MALNREMLEKILSACVPAVSAYVWDKYADMLNDFEAFKDMLNDRSEKFIKVLFMYSLLHPETEGLHTICDMFFLVLFHRSLL